MRQQRRPVTLWRPRPRRLPQKLLLPLQLMLPRRSRPQQKVRAASRLKQGRLLTFVDGSLHTLISTCLSCLLPACLPCTCTLSVCLGTNILGKGAVLPHVDASPHCSQVS